MEYVIKELLHPEEDDEANFIYSELDSQRRETRRVEFYPSGMCFAYGGDMGQDRRREAEGAEKAAGGKR